MSYLLRMLSLVVCLFLGFASIAVWAVETNHSDDLIEQAWACGPIFNKREVWAGQLRQTKADGQLESFEEGKLRLAKSLLQFQRCPDQANDEQIRNAFIEKYVTSLYWRLKMEEQSSLQILWEGKKEPALVNGAFSTLPREGDVSIVGIDISHKFEFESRERERLQQLQQEQKYAQKRLEARQEEERIRAVAEAAAKEALMIRQSQLKNGSIPVSNYDDAVLLHDPDSLDSLMMSPLLRPNKAIYAGEVTLDGDEAENVLRVKIGGYRHPVWGWVDLTYATLQLTKKTIDYSKRSMRIGGTIKVIGRYVQNKKYTTVARQEKTMPVIELMYIGD